MVFGARITLTSPDPSASITNPHNEHEHSHTHTAFSESHTVTFSAHKSSTSSAPTLNIPKSDEKSESETSTLHDSSPESFEQRIKATIDSVPLYDNNDPNDYQQELVQTEQKKNEDAENERNESIELEATKNDVSKDEL